MSTAVESKLPVIEQTPRAYAVQYDRSHTGAERVWTWMHQHGYGGRVFWYTESGVVSIQTHKGNRWIDLRDTDWVVAYAREVHILSNDRFGLLAVWLEHQPTS